MVGFRGSSTLLGQPEWRLPPGTKALRPEPPETGLARPVILSWLSSGRCCRTPIGPLPSFDTLPPVSQAPPNPSVGPPAAPDLARARRYRQAGAVYVVLGLSVVAVTVWSPEMLAPERRQDFVHLLIGLPFFFVFGLAIAYGDRIVAAPLRWMGVSAPRVTRLGRGCQRVLTILLSLSAGVRTVIFAANAVGVRPRLHPLRLETLDAAPRMALAALLMIVIAAFLVRAWWPRPPQGPPVAAGAPP